MYSFINTTTKDLYDHFKKIQNVSFEYVPNTATGFEESRKYINANGYKYFLSALTEKDYFLMLESKIKDLCMFFEVDGDRVTIKTATHQGRKEKSDRYLKKYMQLLTLIHSVLKYDGIITFKRYA